MPPRPRPSRTRPETAGYQALGVLMGNLPEIAILRRFRSAAALDLLYQQASLQKAITKWGTTVQNDKNDDKRCRFDFRFSLLQESVNSDQSTDGRQWREWCEISDKLDRYYDKMLRFQRMCSLAPVDEFQLRSLRQFLSSPRGGDSFLEGIEEHLYASPNESDLVSIANTESPDGFTGFVRGRVSYFWNILTRGNRSGRTLLLPRLAGNGKIKYDLIEHSPEVIQTWSRVLYALLTSFLVGLAVFTLNWVKGFWGRLGLVLLHNILFTLGMALLTNVKPVELFAAAAAYAAVLVVFASGSFGLAAADST